MPQRQAQLEAVSSGQRWGWSDSRQHDCFIASAKLNSVARKTHSRNQGRRYWRMGSSREIAVSRQYGAVLDIPTTSTSRRMSKTSHRTTQMPQQRSSLSDQVYQTRCPPFRGLSADYWLTCRSSTREASIWALFVFVVYLFADDLRQLAATTRSRSFRRNGQFRVSLIHHVRHFANHSARFICTILVVHTTSISWFFLHVFGNIQLGGGWGDDVDQFSQAHRCLLPSQGESLDIDDVITRLLEGLFVSSGSV